MKSSAKIFEPVIKCNLGQFHDLVHETILLSFCQPDYLSLCFSGQKTSYWMKTTNLCRRRILNHDVTFSCGYRAQERKSCRFVCLCVLNRSLSWILPMHPMLLLASDISDRLILIWSYAGAWRSWESYLKDGVIIWSLYKAGMETNLLTFQVSANVLDLLLQNFVQRGLFQVCFILGMPHRYKTGAPEDDASSFLSASESATGLFGCLLQLKRGGNWNPEFPSWIQGW